MLCLRSIASAVLMLGSPTSTPAVVGADGTAIEPAERPVYGAAPLGTGTAAPSSGAPARDFAPLSAPAMRLSTPPRRSPEAASAPLRPGAGTVSAPGTVWRPIDRVDVPRGADAPTASATLVAPLGHVPSLTREHAPPRRIDLVRIEFLVGPVWRIRATEVMALAGVEFGHLRGFSGAVQGGVIVAPDRNVVAVADFPIGAGFVYRHRFGQRSLYGSAGLTAGLLIHRAVTDRGLVHHVDPDFQVPLRLAWTVGEVGFSLALLQGFSTRSRTYVRRGTEVWHRIPYRIGFAVGIHFDVGVGRKRSCRSDRPPKGLP